MTLARLSRIPYVSNLIGPVRNFECLGKLFAHKVTWHSFFSALGSPLPHSLHSHLHCKSCEERIRGWRHEESSCEWLAELSKVYIFCSHSCRLCVSFSSTEMCSHQTLANGRGEFLEFGGELHAALFCSSLKRLEYNFKSRKCTYLILFCDSFSSLF